MRHVRAARTFGGLLAISALLSAAAARGEVNRWDSIGPPPMFGGNQVINVYGLAFGSDGTLFIADSIGVFKGTGDGTWQAVLQIPFPAAFPPFQGFTSILAQPGSPDTMLAGLSNGSVYRTTDGGRTWTSGLGGSGFLSMANGSSSPRVVYASVRLVQSFATSRSADGGATWTELPALDASPVQVLAVDPSSSDVVYGYIGASSSGMPAGVYRSTDTGGTWSRLSGGLADDVYKALAVDPSSPSTVYAGSNANGIFRSDDGGASWSPVDEGLGSLGVRQIVIDPTDPALVYAGTTAGVYRSTDRGGHWSSIGFHQQTTMSLTLDPSSPSTLYAGVFAGFARITLAPAAPCVPGPESLCLNGGRFRVETTWRTPTPAASNVAQSFPITDDTGAFWFFDAANLEIVLKVLDGRGVNGNYWVFFGALSNLEYMITVTDTQTGSIQSYYYPGGTVVSNADTSAFPGESGVSSPLVRRSGSAASTAGVAGLCVPDGQTLCQLGGRFQVRVAWQGSPAGPIQSASAIALTDDTGYFWFFDAANIELVVKTLDGTATNGHFWIFSGALSNVHYTITVTDLQTGAVQTYENPFGRLESFADTSAF